MNFLKKLGVLLFLNLPTVVFVILKLTNVIDWPWPVVTALFWAPIAFILGILLLMLLFMLAGVGVAGTLFAAMWGGLKRTMTGKDSNTIEVEDVEVVEIGNS